MPTYLCSSVSGSTKMFSCRSSTLRNTKESRLGFGTAENRLRAQAQPSFMFLCRTLRGLTGGKLITRKGTPEASNQICVLSLSVRQDLTAGASTTSRPQQGTTLQHYHQSPLPQLSSKWSTSPYIWGSLELSPHFPLLLQFSDYHGVWMDSPDFRRDTVCRLGGMCFRATFFR